MRGGGSVPVLGTFLAVLYFLLYECSTSAFELLVGVELFWLKIVRGGVSHGT